MNIFTLHAINEPIKRDKPITGSLALRELYIQHDWKKPKTNILFSYTKNPSNASAIRNLVYIEDSKTYTFSDIQKLVIKHLAREGVKIFHNGGRVTFMITKGADVSVSFCSELLEVLRFPKGNDLSGNIQGDLVAEEDITLTFANPQMLYLKCPQLEDPILAMVPVSKPVVFRDDNPLFIDLKTDMSIYELDFLLNDENGGKLPFEKIDFRVLNKE